jgi:hypothetical protein
VLPSLLTLVQVERVYLRMPLGRDPMIFQYTAWAVTQGEVLYRDIFDVNGPLITLLHVAFQAIGGEHAPGMRCIDLCMRALVFSFVGMTLLHATQRADATAPHWSERLTWSVIALVTLLGVYSSFDFWDSAQRDGWYFLWTLASAALQLHALQTDSRAGWSAGPRWSAGARGMLVAGALSGVTWLGKPSFVVFSIMQAAALTFACGTSGLPAWQQRLATTARFVVGCALGALATALVSSRIADMGGWLELLGRDVLTVYRHMAAVDAANYETMVKKCNACHDHFADGKHQLTP